MAIKPNGKFCKIREQIIEDPVSGLTLQFEIRDNETTKLLIYGDLPYGNRELVFDQQGEMTASGVALGYVCRPSWIRAIKD